jgi:hypothetical protein
LKITISQFLGTLASMASDYAITDRSQQHTNKLAEQRLNGWKQLEQLRTQLRYVKLESIWLASSKEINALTTQAWLSSASQALMAFSQLPQESHRAIIPWMPCIADYLNSVARVLNHPSENSTAAWIEHFSQLEQHYHRLKCEGNEDNNQIIDAIYAPLSQFHQWLSQR